MKDLRVSQLSGRPSWPAQIIGDREPTMMNVITHGYLSSRVPFIDTFEQIIAYAKRHSDVWFARRGDIAAWARKYYEEQ